ncbi:hypothetical protein AC1031_014392 [Aphanomyces cochlioides]|nr:hypothetical protein AC1031_014392 [Aphanomyces cochlioides]
MVATLLDKRCDDYGASFGKVALAINTLHVVAAFADKRGLGHNDYAYGSAKGAALDDDGSDGYSELAPTNDASTKRQAIVSAELERQRAKRVKKLDIGQSLAEGMKDMHRIPSETRERENSKLLDAINKLQATVDQGESIQNKLLNFLRNSNNSI